jgi:hypothetical protein
VNTEQREEGSRASHLKHYNISIFLCIFIVYTKCVIELFMSI